MTGGERGGGGGRRGRREEGKEGGGERGGRGNKEGEVHARKQAVEEMEGGEVGERVGGKEERRGVRGREWKGKRE